MLLHFIYAVIIFIQLDSEITKESKKKWFLWNFNRILNKLTYVINTKISSFENNIDNAGRQQFPPKYIKTTHTTRRI